MKVIVSLHLKPLPGSPNFSDMDEVIDHALRNALIIEDSGADAIIVENFGDKPFLMKAPPETVAAMSVVVREVVRELSIPVGVNVLRNDGISAVAISKATGAKFVRINQLIFPSLMPEGLALPFSGELARYMRFIGCRAKVLADILVKHSVQLAALDDYVENLDRIFCHAIVITGKSTGKAPNPELFSELRKRVDLPLILGSGATPENVSRFDADGVIVGSYVKEGEEYDPGKLRKFVSSARNVGGDFEI